jgi:hypothetical protein
MPPAEADVPHCILSRNVQLIFLLLYILISLKKENKLSAPIFVRIQDLYRSFITEIN